MIRITRTSRQAITHQKILAAKGKGYLDITMGVGKTRIIINFILEVLKVRPNYTSTIVVPTIDLKVQWEKELEFWEVKNYQVVVINGVTQRNTPFNTHITVIEESHLHLRAKTFSRVFQLATGPYLLCISGTWSSDDKRIIGSFLPCIDTITQEEALENGWISKSVEYNLGIEMSPEDKIIYDLINQRHDEYFAHFGHNFEDAKTCFTYQGALSYVIARGLHDPELSREKLARKLADKANIWQEYTQKRLTFINSHEGKIQVVAQLLNNLPDRKAITFGALIPTAEKLTQLIFSSRLFHSKLKGCYINNSILERYGFKTKKKGTLTKLGVANLRRLYIKQFNSGDFRVLNTIRAVDLGVDIKGCNCSIIYGRNSRANKALQREARSTRAEEDEKLALIVNVYIKGTKDEQFLRNCQKGKKGIIKVDSVQQLIIHFNNLKGE